MVVWNKEAQLLVRNNHVVLSDSFIQFGQTKKQFYSIENDRLDFTARDFSFSLYASIVIRMEAREDTYERTVFSFFDFTGLVGGVFEILEVIGSIVVSFFANRLFMFWMLSNLYQVQMKFPQTTNAEKGDLNLKRYGMIKRKVRDNIALKRDILGNSMVRKIDILAKK